MQVNDIESMRNGFIHFVRHKELGGLVVCCHADGERNAQMVHGCIRCWLASPRASSNHQVVMVVVGGTGRRGLLYGCGESRMLH